MPKYTGIHTDDQVKLAQLGLIKLAEKKHARQSDDAMTEQRRREDNTMRRREKHVVTRQRLIHGRQGPQLERDYLAVNEAGNIVATEFGHEAKTFDDVYEASGLASRAQRERGGNWQALPVSVINQEARQAFGIGRHLQTLPNATVQKGDSLT